MAIRWYISTIVGPIQEAGEPDRYEPAIAQAVPGVSYVLFVPHAPDGRPAFTWVIAYCQGADYSGVEADNRNFRVFNPIDDWATPAEMLTSLSSVRVNQIPAQRRNAIQAKLDALGIPTGDITGSTSLRAVLQKIGRFLQINFDETKFSVG